MLVCGIYVSSANKAVTYAMALFHRMGKCSNVIDSELNAIAKQIEQKIHKEYYLARMIRCGIAYHIGALPAEIRAKIEYLLRKGLIRYCFCTSTLLEGVNVPADNLFVFDNKKGPAAMSTIDAFNLIGRAGRVTLNEMGNVYIVIDDGRKQRYFDELLLKPLPNQELLPQKAFEKRHKKAIASMLLQGKTNLIEVDEKCSDRGFTETTYEYATKCLNMLVHDICAKNDSYIVRDFRKNDVLTPQNIIDIRKIFGEIVSKDDDINISARQKQSLYQTVANTEITYPDNFNYYTCLNFLRKLSQIFDWPIYEKSTLGKGNRLDYYTVILLQWMEGRGLHEIIRGAISYYQEHGGKLASYDPTYHLKKYNGSPNHKNQVINEAMKDIEQIINYKFSMYFLRFSEAIIMATLFFRLGRMTLHRDVAQEYICESLDANGKVVYTTNRHLRWFQFDIGTDIMESLNFHAEGLHIDEGITISLEAFLCFFELLLQNEDSKYYDKKGDLTSGRIPTSDSMLLLSATLLGHIKLSVLLQRFVSGFGIAHCGINEIEPATDGLVRIVDRKSDISDYFDSHNIAYRSGSYITIKGQKYRALLKTNTPKVAVFTSMAEEAELELRGAGWNVFDINTLIEDAEYHSFLSLYEAT